MSAVSARAMVGDEVCVSEAGMMFAGGKWGVACERGIDSAVAGVVVKLW